MRRIGNRAVSWLVAAAVTAMLSPASMSFGAQNGPDTINSAAIIAADGISGQTLTTGSGIKTGHIADGAVTASKLGIVCANGEYLQYVFGSGWVCSTGTAGAPGATGATGQQGLTGATGPQGPAGIAPHYANVVVVAKSGGDFTDPVAAVNSITDASANNPYLIKVMPGIYDIGSSTINLLPYITLQGSSEVATVITGSNSSSVVICKNNTELNSITIQNTGGSAITIDGDAKLSNITVKSLNNFAIGIRTVSGTSSLNNITITANGASVYGLLVDGSNFGSQFPSYVTVTNSNITVENQGGLYGTAIGNFTGSQVAILNVTAKSSDLVLNNTGIASIVNSSLYGSSTGVSNGGSATIKNSIISSSGNAIYAYQGWSFQNPEVPVTRLIDNELTGIIYLDRVPNYNTVNCLNNYNQNLVPVVCP